MTLYKSRCYQIGSNAEFKEEVFIETVEDFKSVVAENDHMFSEMAGGYRKVANFISSNVMGFDIDNSSEPYYSIEDFSKDFKSYSWFLATSKSSNILKHNNTEDRFHIYFPLSIRMSDPVKLKYYLKQMAKMFPFDVVDKSCLEVSRQFFANKNTKCYMNSGDFIDLNIPPEVIVVKKKQSKMRVMDSYEHNRLMIMLKIKADKEGIFNDYSDWLKLGIALKSAGFTIEDWLYLSSGNENENTLKNKWNGFDKIEGGVTAGSLYYYIGEC